MNTHFVKTISHYSGAREGEMETEGSRVRLPRFIAQLYFVAM